MGGFLSTHPSKAVSSMQTQSDHNHRRRRQPLVQPLEGKSLLSGGAAMHHVPAEVAAERISAQVPAPISGSLTGTYSNAHIPFAGYLLSYSTSGTLTGVGSTRLKGSFFVRGKALPGRLLGQFTLHNSGGAMLIKVFQSATAGADTYKVARANGSDTGFKGGSGNLTITDKPTFSAPYYVSGQATMTFTPS
jgi:hypothetical protein